eukprot:TRINITY_DN25915_c0_g1_i1.p1 TRINITY_DN25915_c0_g1~~TRINITY_DN25915_c0_g1_i1.p1  ORF type:complete len:382 (+),score=56.29 TRINITY_DN25915_c0_g1_i1:55-1200(+)
MGSEQLFSIRTAAHCFDVQFHPSESLLTAATVTGDVELHRFDADGGTAEKLRDIRSHEDSCRAARFLAPAEAGGALSLATTSADCYAALADIERGERLWRAKLPAAGSALLAMSDGRRIALGDDDGGVAVYDVRAGGKKATAVAEFSENSDFISDLALGKDGYSLCATSGDGTLAVYDVRKTGTKGLIAMSDFLEDEYLSCAIIRQGTKVVCGSQTGVLAIFTWGDFGDMKDRIPGHPMSVDAIVPFAEDAVLTGSSDGHIRVVSVHSKKHGNSIVGLLAEHGDYPIECLTLSADGNMVASASHSQPAIRVWPTKHAHSLLNGADGSENAKDEADAADEKDSDDSSDAAPTKRQRKKRRKGKHGTKIDTNAARASNFFSGL